MESFRLSSENIKKPSDVLELSHLVNLLDSLDYLNDGHKLENNLISALTQEMDNALSSLKVIVKSIEILETRYSDGRLEQRIRLLEQRRDEIFIKYFTLPHPILQQMDLLVESNVDSAKDRFVFLRDLLETIITKKIQESKDILK